MAMDLDFDWYIFEFEYIKNPDKEYQPNENDRKYLEYCGLLMEANECGIGYRVEWEDTLYICPAPLVKIDTENRFHSLEVPAIRWKGGAELYYIHGAFLENKNIVLHPEKLTKKDWLDEESLEVRRIIQEQMGDSFPKKIGAKLIGKPSKEFKEVHHLLGLYEVMLPKDPEKIAHYVKVQDHSSKRQYYLRVDPKIMDADEALSWTFNKTKDTYKPIQET